MKNIPLVVLQCFTVWCLLLFLGVGAVYPGTPKTIEDILKDLHSPNWRDREKAVFALHKNYPVTAQVVEVLRQALQDPAYQVRSHAVEIGRKLGSDVKVLVPDYLARLKDPQEKYSMKFGLPDFLIQLSDGSPEVVTELLQLAKDIKEELLVRFTSLRALGDVEEGGNVLRHDLRHLAIHDPSLIIQSQAWLSLAHLQPHDEETVHALVKMGQGGYGYRHRLHAGVTSTSFSPLSNALHMLITIGEGGRAIPLFFDALERTEKLSLDIRGFAYYLQEHPAQAKPYVPRLLEIVARSPADLREEYIRIYLIGSLVRIAPGSPTFRKIIEGIKQSQDPKWRKGVKNLLHCIDPQVPQSVKEAFPCALINPHQKTGKKKEKAE